MDLDEAQTRRRIIDKKLAIAGWNVADPMRVSQELDIDLRAGGHSVAGEQTKGHSVTSGTPNPFSGHQFVDYALRLGGKSAAVIEAKRTSVDPNVGKEQALQYAKNLQRQEGDKLPFVFYTNGFDSYFWEYGFYPPAKVHGFPTQDDLEWLVERRDSRRPLSAEMISTSIVERDYQFAAIRRILEGLEAKRRKFLLVMATGTGKTRTAVALLDVLMRARWAKRVLFLVDRIALRDQALDAFKEHMPSEPRWPNLGETEFSKDRRVYVTTYPTMLGLIQRGDSPENWISPHFFDVVVADESHRSIYDTYRQVLDYFNAVKLGLTATPQDKIDRDTFALFDCDAQEPSFAYTYEEAVNRTPPCLSSFEVLKVRSKFQLEGIHGGVLPEAVQRRLVAEGKDPEAIDFEGTDLERRVTNAGTNGLIVREFMEESIKDPSGTLPGKTIIFAISKAHARRLEELFDRLYPEHAGRLARVILSEDPRVHGKGGLLDQFKNQDMPRVAVSVDMLDTGVDIREVVNLVFAKPVYSFVKFWQMIGRGTRVLEDDPTRRKAWCPEKDKFLIIDCWGAFDFFGMHPAGREPGAQTPLPVRLFRGRLDKLEAAMAADESDIVEAVKADLRKDVAALPANNVVVLDKQGDLAALKPERFWAALGAEGIGFLRGVIAPVLRARSDADFKAMRFEAEVVELGTARLAGNEEAVVAIKESLVEQIGDLPLTVNIVAKEQDLIRAALGEGWWSGIDEAKLAALVERLAPLMRFRQPKRESIITLDIGDLVAIKEWVEFGPEHERMSTGAYRAKVEALVRELVAENPVLRKLQAGEPVSDAELGELAEVLGHSVLHVTEGVLQRVYDNKGARFIQFMRHILGLETVEPWSEVVSKAFDRFTAEHTDFTSKQLLFLQTLKTFLLQKEAVEREDLISQPFTNIDPRGIRGVFLPPQIAEIEGLVQKIGQYIN